MSDFIVQDGSVWMVGKHAPWRMSDHAVDVMLDLFEDALQYARFHDLYEAQKRAMGELFIPRATAARQRPTLVWDVEDAVFTRQLEAQP